MARLRFLPRLRRCLAVVSLIALGPMLWGTLQSFSLDGYISYVRTGGESLFHVGDGVSGSFTVEEDPSVHPPPYRTLRSYADLVPNFALDFSNGKRFRATNVVAEVDSSFAYDDYREPLRIPDNDYFKIWASDLYADRFDFGAAQVLASETYDGDPNGNNLILDDIRAYFFDADGNFFHDEPPFMQPLVPSEFEYVRIVMVWKDPAFGNINLPGARYVEVHAIINSFQFSDGDPEPNTAPSLQSPGNRSVAEGGTLAFDLSASDPEGDALTYSMTGAPDGATLSGNRFRYSPGYGVVTSGDSWSFAVKFTVADTGGLTASRTIQLTVQNTNRDPVLSSPGSREIEEGSTLSVNLIASDPDDDPLVFSLGASVPGASINGEVLTYLPPVGTVPSGDYRDLDLPIIVRDGKGGSDEAFLRVRVVPQPLDEPDFTTVVETPMFIIEGSLDNDARGEGLDEGFDGKVTTKCLHWSPVTTYRITPKLFGWIDAIDLVTGNDAPERDPIWMILSGLAPIALDPPLARRSAYGVEFTGGYRIDEGVSFILELESADDALIQYSEMRFEVREDTGGEPEPPPLGDFTARLETNLFTIDTLNVNDGDNGNQESLPEGFDGDERTKCLHWSPVALYRFTPKVTGRITRWNFLTANDAPIRDVASIVLPDRTTLLEFAPPTNRFTEYGADVPDGFAVTAGVPFEIQLVARGTALLQYAEMDLVVVEPPPVEFTARAETADFVIQTRNDNVGTNGRLEGLAQGLDGSTSTKCLHWAPDALYELTSKRSGRLTALVFTTANDAPDRDPKYFSIEGVSGELVADPPISRRMKYRVELPDGGLNLQAGVPVYLHMAAGGTELLQYAEIQLEVGF